MNMSTGKNAADPLSRLVKAIELLGVDNITTLSEQAGLPIETARYMVWHELPKRLISINADINFDKIGLGRWMLQFTPGENLVRAGLNGILGNSVGTIYSARVMPGQSFVSIVAIPHGQHYKLWMKMEDLVGKGIIRSYSLQPMQYMQNRSLDLSTFDLKKGNWDFSWDEIGNHGASSTANEARPKIRKEEDPFKVDYSDILILRELQKRNPRSITKISRIIGVDHHSLRYHYNHHVKEVINGYRITVLPEEYGEQSSFLFSFDTNDEKSETEIRNFAHSLPFTTVEWKIGNQYNWKIGTPAKYASRLLRHVRDRSCRIKGTLNTLIIDPMSEFHAPVPYQFFDVKSGEWKYEPELAQELSSPFLVLKKMCRFESQAKCNVYEPRIQKCDVESCPFVRA